MAAKVQEKIQTLHCDRCTGWLRLEFKNFDEIIEGVRITVPEMPILSCPECSLDYRPDWTKEFIRYAVSESKKRSKKQFNGTRRSEASKTRFDLCKSVHFKYDASDCEFIPGLKGMAPNGFFAPVFFNRKVLHKYMDFDEYRVDIAGNSYGTIFHEDWYLSFGINRSGKLFVWLGDLDEIPQSEQQYLLSENIESDHDVGSDFYLGQREAEFCKLSNEGQLLEDKSAFEKVCFDSHKVKVYHYEPDIYENLRVLVRPVNWNEKGTMHVVNSLNKIFVESINTDALRRDIASLDPNFRADGLGGLKLLQKWISLRYPSVDAAEIMKPFFVLYDWRQVHDHKMDKEKKEKQLDSCYNRFGLKSGSLESLYDAIVSSMSASFRQLASGG